MSIGWWIFIIICWSMLGLAFIVPFMAMNESEIMKNAEGFEFVNPIYIHKYSRVNWFGAIVLALLLSAICPIVTAIYWFYKLCTVGRR